MICELTPQPEPPFSGDAEARRSGARRARVGDAVADAGRFRAPLRKAFASRLNGVSGVVAALLLLAGSAAAADPVVVVLPAKANAGTAVVTLGQIAKLHGGSDAVRAKIAAVDIADRKKKDAAVTVTSRQVEFRLKLAGYTADDVIVGGAETTAVGVARKTVTADEVVAAAAKALVAEFPKADEVTADLAQTIAVKLPEVLAEDAVSITAKPRAVPVKLGRTEMEVTITVNGERPFSFPVHLTAKSAAHPLLVTKGQKVRLVVRLGGLDVEATGEAAEDGRRGELVKVFNPASKKTVVGRPTAVGVVDVELGGAP